MKPKKTNNYFLIVTLILFFLSCKEKSDYTVLTGFVKNGKETIELRAQYNSHKKGKIIHLNDDGTFLDSIKIKKGELYLISDKTNMIEFYLSPLKKYTLEYDAKKFRDEGVNLNGDGVFINEYYTENTRGSAFYKFDASGKSEQEIRSFLNGIKNEKHKRLEESKLPIELKVHEKLSIKYEYLRYLNLYLKINNINAPSIDSANELNIDYSDEKAFKEYTYYKDLVHDYYNEQLYKKTEEYKKLDSTYAIHQNAIKELASIVKNEHIKNDMIEYGARFYLESSRDIDACYKNFKTYYTGNDTLVKAEMLDLYNRYGRLKKGTPSPKFTKYKNYEGGTSSLDDFKGSYVFIDIWGTWCGNCYGEMPALKKLEHKYKEIVFLSIAWKDDLDKWRNTIKKEGLTGIHLYAPKKDTSFFDEYAVTGIPRYILIDPEGNIIDHSTPRPSDKKLNTLFESLNI